MSQHDDELMARFEAVNKALESPILTEQQRDELLGELDEIEYLACLKDAGGGGE